MVSEGQTAPKHDNAEAPANGIGQGVGALLHASRLRCAENVENVAHMLRIRTVHLVAIEEGRFNDLPGPTYALGFVRAYADYLGLDSAEVVRRYKQEISTVAKVSNLVFPSPIPEGGAPGGAILLVGVVVALVAYGAWYVSTSENRFFTEVISPLPARLAALFSSADPAPPEAPAPAAPSSLPATGGESAAETPAEILAAPTTDSAEAPEAVGETAVTAPAAEQAAAEQAAENADEAMPVMPVMPVKPAMPSVAVTAPTAPTAPTASTVAATGGEETAAGETPAAPSSAGSSRTAEVPKDTPPTTAASETADESESTTVSPGSAAAVENGGAQQGEAASAVSEPADAGAESAALPPAPAETPVETPIEAAPSAAPPTQPATSRIVVRAKTDSWIQVRDSVANQLLLTRLLRAGDSYEVPDRDGLQLLTGNAGALEILVDGEAVPAIGPAGAVRRGVALDIERLREGTASGE